MTLADAETDLRNAIDHGDPEGIATAGALVDKYDPRWRPNLLGSALYYATVAGLRVFPLQPGSKIPYRGSRGCKDATTDAGQISAWWTTRPTSNIGISTGGPYDVIDIDGAEGQRSRVAHWDDIFAKVEVESVGKALTPRGMHIYVTATGDGNSAGLLPGVDYRGIGGYAVAPPSVIASPNPGSYQWLGTPNL